MFVKVLNIVWCSIICFYSCSTHINTIASNNKDRANKVVYSNKNTIIVKQDSTIIDLFTESYMRDKMIIYSKENRGEISQEIEYKVRLSKESEKMVEKAGGMYSIMKTLLSKQNFNVISESRFLVFYRVTMSLDGKQVTGTNISIRSKNISQLNLTEREIKKVYDYFKKLTFDYSGNEFLNEIVPVSWVFSVKKN